ncbi:hypothetical protein D3C76_1797090 [compost metagenome]
MNSTITFPAPETQHPYNMASRNRGVSSSNSVCTERNARQSGRVSNHSWVSQPGKGPLSASTPGKASTI